MIAIREVGPRDGFQNEPETIGTDDKVRLVELLSRSGLRRIELTSFVRSRSRSPRSSASCRARGENLRCEAAIGVSFGCPYEGTVPPERVFAIARRLVLAGVQEVSFGDTSGMANPRQVRDFLPAARAALGDEVELTAHFDNTRGQGLANVVAALDAGCESFGELGGCPVPAGATGNVATEDVVSMPHEMGEETGIDLDALLEAAREAQRVLGRPLGSRTLVAGPVVWHA